MRVAVYRIAEHHRSKVIAEALMKGLAAAGYDPFIQMESQYFSPVAPMAAFYGLEGKMPDVLKRYSQKGRHVLMVDLGYWERKTPTSRFTGYHKIAVNDRHPTVYFQKATHPRDRMARLNLKVQPWRSGDHIVVAGMGDKGARAEGFEPEQWERAIIAEIRKHSKRPIIYRPKPSWKSAQPIHGVGFSPRTQTFDIVLRNAHAVVTHHSNCAVDAIVNGVPAFCWHGVAACMSSHDISEIERPYRPEGREQWIADIAYTQWTVAEIGTAAPYEHLRSEGIIP